MEVSDKKFRNSLKVVAIFSFILSHTYLCLYRLLAENKEIVALL